MMDVFTMPDDEDLPRGALDAEALTRALAERLDAVVPRPLRVGASGDRFEFGLPPHLSSNGIGGIAEDANHSDGEGVEQELLLHACDAALANVQDWIIDNWLQEPWPVWHHALAKDPVPHHWAVVRDDEIHLGYGEEDAPVLVLPPIPLADVMRGPWRWCESEADSGEIQLLGGFQEGFVHVRVPLDSDEPDFQVVRRVRRETDPAAVAAINDFARRLGQDLMLAGAGFAVACRPLSSESLHLVTFPFWPDRPDVLDLEAVVLQGGAEFMTFTFDDGRDLFEQFVEVLSTLEDEVSEETTEQWPLCPTHRYWMDPCAKRGVVGWCCRGPEAHFIPLSSVDEGGGAESE